MRGRRTLLVAAFAALATGLATVAAAPAPAGVAQTAVVSADPAHNTPNVLDGAVKAIAQVGDTVILGGAFTQVQAASGGPVLTRNNIVAFSATTGAISTAFAPGTDDEVSAIVPAADGRSVYVGGFFITVNGVKSRRLAQLNLTDGALVPAFAPPAMDGKVKDLRLVGDRLWVAGSFTTIAGQGQPALASVDAVTGAFDPYMSLPFSSPQRGGALQVLKIDVTGNGSRLAAIGNFGAVAGQSRPQLVMLDLTGPGARLADWATSTYAPDCASVFDTYMRDLDFSPDGSFFVVSTTGAYRGYNGVPCDTTMRWETAASGTSIAPTWIDYTGGDTTYAVAVTGAAVYVGGHFRWQNNPFAGDKAGPGAVGREGIAALDPTNGLPLRWNPGRDRGVGVFDMLATPTGLWVGSDTDRIGRWEYRARIAFFPLAGGFTPAPYATGVLPGHVFLAGVPSTAPAPTADSVLYRVNVGGPQLPSGDAGPAWASDSSASGYRNAGSNVSNWPAVGGVDGSVPATTPAAVFDSERWDPATGEEMKWSFPVATGTELQVRLYFASRCSCTSTPGSRVFDVNVDGRTALTKFDIVAAVGQDVGMMRSFDLTSDGTVNIDFVHGTENPVVSAIEIVRAPATAATPGGDDLRDVYFDGSAAGPATAVDGTGIAWGSSRGSVMIDGNVYTGYTDGSFTRRTFDGTSFGPAVAVDGSDRIVRLDAWHGEVARITGMFFDRGRLYFTLSGDSTLYYRYFTPEDDVVGALRLTGSPSVAGADFGKVAGMFLTGGKLYLASSTDGTLRRVDWSNGAPVPGTAVVVGGPAVDGIDWRSRGMFVYTGRNLPGGANQAPTAALTVTCADLSCTADGAGSADSDGSIAGYSWNFGDGDTATGADATHSYATAGDYTVTLTVTDDDGATGSASQQVSVSAPAPPPATSVGYVGSSAVNANATSFGVTVPPAVADGDALLLFATTASTVTPAPPDGGNGWKVAGTLDMSGSNGRTTVWSKVATAGDAGRQVTLTLPDMSKAAVTLLAYSGTATAGPVAVVESAAENVSRAEHTTPAVTVGAAGSVVVSYWADRSSSTTSWTAPQGEVERGQTAGAGGGRITSLVTDSGTAVPLGTRAGVTATADGVSARAAMFSIVLAARG